MCIRDRRWDCGRADSSRRRLFIRQGCRRCKSTITGRPVSYTHLDVYKRQANDDSTVTITGISVAEGFEEADLAVEIPETIDGMTVTKIEGSRWSTFAGYHVTSVSIPASVTEIGAGAFMNCQYLTQVTFAEGSAPSFEDAYQSDQNGVFAGCTALTSIELPAGTTKLGTYMFSGCESLTSVNLSELTQITEIPFRAFERCTLSSVELPGNISRVAQDAFSANYICTDVYKRQ